MINIKPRNGLRVPNPETGRPLPDEGLAVSDSSYWRRRIAEGAVEISEAKAITAPAQKPVKNESKAPEEGDQK